MKKSLLLLLAGTAFLVKAGNIDELHKYISAGDSEKVDHIISSQTFTPKEIRMAYTLAHAVADQRAAASRTRWEWLSMLGCGGIGAAWAYTLVTKDIPKFKIFRGIFNGLITYLGFRFAFQSFKAPYQRHTDSAVVADLLRDKASKTL